MLTLSVPNKSWVLTFYLTRFTRMATPRELILSKKLPMAPFEINAVFALLSFALGILTLVVSICSQTCPLVMKNLVFL
jgi:hypothetical protein